MHWKHAIHYSQSGTPRNLVNLTPTSTNLIEFSETRDEVSPLAGRLKIAQRLLNDGCITTVTVVILEFCLLRVHHALVLPQHAQCPSGQQERGALVTAETDRHETNVHCTAVCFTKHIRNRMILLATYIYMY